MTLCSNSTASYCHHKCWVVRTEWVSASHGLDSAHFSSSPLGLEVQILTMDFDLFFSGCDIQIMGPSQIHQSSAWFRIKRVGFREIRWMWWRDNEVCSPGKQDGGWLLSEVHLRNLGYVRNWKQVLFHHRRGRRCVKHENKSPKVLVKKRWGECLFTLSAGLAASLIHTTLCSAAAANGAPGAGRIPAFCVQEISPPQGLENANQEEPHAEMAQLLFQASGVRLTWHEQS